MSSLFPESEPNQKGAWWSYRKKGFISQLPSEKQARKYHGKGRALPSLRARSEACFVCICGCLSSPPDVQASAISIYFISSGFLHIATISFLATKIRNFGDNEWSFFWTPDFDWLKITNTHLKAPGMGGRGTTSSFPRVRESSIPTLSLSCDDTYMNGNIDRIRIHFAFIIAAIWNTRFSSVSL